MIGVPGFAVAALRVSLSLARNPHRAAARRPLLAWAAACCAALLLMNACVAQVLLQAGGPVHVTGWLHRLVVAAFLGWQWTAARRPD